MSAPCDFRGASPLIGRSTPINSLRRKIENLANASITVVITGESGTGKELIARCLHAQANPQGPFVVVDCSTVFEARINAASEGRTGEHSDFFNLKCREAEGGTLFLKHVERLPSRTQAKLSRAIQNEANCKIGGSQAVTRIIASAREDCADFATETCSCQSCVTRCQLCTWRVSLFGRCWRMFLSYLRCF